MIEQNFEAKNEANREMITQIVENVLLGFEGYVATKVDSITIQVKHEILPIH